jgi:hypothetical protein
LTRSAPGMSRSCASIHLIAAFTGASPAAIPIA